MSLDFRILNNVKSWNEVSKVLRALYTNTLEKFGTMALQDADNVNISGGAISGTDVDVSAATLSLADDQIDVDKIGTTETDTEKVLAPDGSGGVEWIENRGGGDIVTVKETLRLWDGAAEYNEDFDMPLSDGDGNILVA